MRYLILALALVATPAMAIEIMWTPPDTREDGTALAPEEIDHYELMCGTSGDYSIVSYQVPAMSPDGRHSADSGDVFPDHGTYQCVLVSVDTHGQRSEPSNSVEYQYLPAAPTRIIDLTAE